GCALFRPNRLRRCRRSHTLDIRGAATHPESEEQLFWTRCIRRFHTQFHLRTFSWATDKDARMKKSNTRELRIRTSEPGCFLKLTASAVLEKTRSIHDFVSKFFDDWICQDFLGHALDLFFGGFAGHAVQIEHEKLALADFANLGKAQR